MLRHIPGVVVDQAARAAHAGITERLDDLAQPVGFRNRIIVDEGNNFARSDPDPYVARHGKVALGTFDDFDFPAIPLQQLSGAIHAWSGNDANLEIVIV